MVRDPYCSVADCWDEEGWGMDFKRTLTIHEYNRWIELKDSLADITPSSDKDLVYQDLDKSKCSTTKSLYRFLSDSGVSSRVVGLIWKSKVPLKIKFFLWQTFNNKLQVAKSLVKRGWRGNCQCYLCSCVEDINHILFRCHLATLVWGMIQEIYDIQYCPRSLGELSSFWFLGKGPWPKRMIMFVFAGFAQALWTCRNKMMIEKQFPKSPTDVIYTALSFMQKWSYLLKDSDREQVTQIKEDVTKWLKGFKTSAPSLSNVVEF